MDVEQLRANFKAAVDAISAQKPPSVGMDKSVKLIKMYCPKLLNCRALISLMVFVFRIN